VKMLAVEEALSLHAASEDGGTVRGSLTGWLRAGVVGVVQAHAASAGPPLVQVVWPEAHPWHLVPSPHRPHRPNRPHATPHSVGEFRRLCR
jgi:hypothetical protein